MRIGECINECSFNPALFFKYYRFERLLPKFRILRGYLTNFCEQISPYLLPTIRAVRHFVLDTALLQHIVPLYTAIRDLKKRLGSLLTLRCSCQDNT